MASLPDSMCYRKALAEAGALDFDEQIYRSIEILLSDPEARASAQRRCRHLLVDEFQDLNAAHMLLIRLLCAPAYSCFGVGDDDQVIYGYSGATPEYLINFGEYFPGAHEYALEINYRCPPQVVTAANNVLSYNRQRIPKTITTPAGRSDTLRDFDPPVRGRGSVSVVSSPAEQLPQTRCRRHLGLEGRRGRRSGDRCLSRVNSSLLPVQIALTEAGIPCTAPLGPNVLQRTGIRTALAYLRMGLAPGEIRREDLVQTIRRPSRGIAPNVVTMLSERSVTSIAEIRGLASRLSGRDVPKLSDYADSIDSVVRGVPEVRGGCLACHPGPGGPGGDDGRVGLVPARGRPIDPCRRPPRPRVSGGPPPRRCHLRDVAPGSARAGAG